MNPKQRAFVEEYLKCWNATEAARRAGYSERTARSIGSENLTKPDIKAEIERRIAEKAMTADEALIRIAEQARADYSQYFNTRGELEISRLIADGKGHLVKGVTYDKAGRRVFEFYDAQAALFKIGQHHRLFTERTEVDVTLRVDGLAELLDKIYG